MTSPFHTDVAAIAKDKGAIVISGKLLTQLVLRSIRDGIKAFALGVTIQTKHPLISAVFAGTAALGDFKATLTRESVLGDGSDHLTVMVDPDFDIEVSLVFNANPKEVFSKIIFGVKNLTLDVIATTNTVEFKLRELDISPVFSTSVTEDQRKHAITESKITDLDLTRYEGSLAYGTGTRLIASLFGGVPPVSLGSLFPGITFAGAIQLFICNDSLLVVPERLTLATLLGCAGGNSMAGTQIDVAKTGSGTESDPFGFGFKQLKAASHIAPPNEAMPLAAIYAPKPLLDLRFGSFAPSLNYRDASSGFISHELHISTTIKSLMVAISSGALKLTVGFAVRGDAKLKVELPSDGSADLGKVSFELPEKNGTSTVTAALRLAVDSSARLSLLTEIESVDLGEANVEVELISKYLQYVGEAIYGYIADYIIGRVLSNILPGMVSDQIRAQLDSHFFVLADLSELTGLMDRIPRAPMFSGVAGSALLGLNSND